jgi:superfamily II DNA or RNA helicase
MARDSVAQAPVMGEPALRTLIGALAEFDWASRERGQRYAAQNRVGRLRVDGHCVSALVHGGDVYDVGWEWDGIRWYPDCTCPVAPYCKHAYALACCILAQGHRQRGFDHPRLASMLPSRLLAPGLFPDAPTARWSPAPRRPAPVRPAAIQRLRAAADIWSRQSALRELLAEAPPDLLTPEYGSMNDILDEPDADLRCWRLAMELHARVDGWVPAVLAPYRERADLAQRFAQRAQAVLAERLVRWAERQRLVPQRSLRLVLKLLRHGSGLTQISAEARLTTPRMADEPRSLQQLRQLLSETRRTPALLPPDQALLLEWLVAHNVGGFSPHFGNAGVMFELLKPLLSRISDSPLASWDTDLPADLAARYGIAPGGPVRLRAEPARLLPACVPRGETIAVELHFFWPDGCEQPLHDVLHFRAPDRGTARQPGVVLADGAFSVVVEEPPPELLDLFAQAGGLPLAGDQRKQLIGLLASRFPHLQHVLDAHTRFYPTSPAAVLDLRPDDWLQIRLFAQVDAPDWRPGQPLPPEAILFEYTAEQGWVRRRAGADETGSRGASYDPLAPEESHAEPAKTEPVSGITSEISSSVSQESTDQLSSAALEEAVRGGPPCEAPCSGEEASAPADVWLEAPDPQSVEPTLAWLAQVGGASGMRRGPGGHQPQWEDRSVGWWLFLHRKHVDGFADAWERRPAGTAYFGNERLRRLLYGAASVTPRLRVTSSGLDWFAVSAEWEAEGLQLSDEDWAALCSATTRFVKLSSGWVRRDVAALQEDTMQVLADLGVEPGGGEQRLTVWQLAGARAESLERIEEWSAGTNALAAVRALRERVAAFTGLVSVPPPGALRAALRPYQQRGLDFLAYASSLGVGAVLADDMGLGKTVQALAWLAHLRAQEAGGGASLVVCPASVVHNWAREAERFAPELRVLLLTRGQARHELRRQIADYDLVVTNYALLRRDLEAWRQVELRAAILDEAQNIKNPDAAVTHAALALQARHRLALTGTPLENRALDLWSIMHFVNPGYLGSRARFESRFDRPDAPPHVRALLAAKLRPVLLRRTKREVAPELPERIEEQRDCELTAGQRRMYLAELRRSRALVEEVSQSAGGLARNKITILAALTRLRQICCHPALAGGNRDLGSGKFEALFELLDPLLAEGHKVLLFSQFVQCLKLLDTELRARGIARHQLTGATVKREAVVAAFQNDERPSVFLISLKAGGTGLNLTAASYVVLFDPWWNPAIEAQAIDRTHRIGQDRTVIAYRMLTRGTVEEKIWELQQRKRALVSDILGEDGFARTLTRDDLEYLLATE